MGAEPSAVADARRPGLSAERRRAVRRGRPRGARGLDRREPLRRDRQLVLHDGGGAADPELDVVLPRLPREPRLGGPRLPRAVPVRPLPARRLHADGTSSTPTSTATTARRTRPGSSSRVCSSARDEDPRAVAGARAGRCCARSSRARSTPDGVDFEASVAYHRLVAELFLLPALYRRALRARRAARVPGAPRGDGALHRRVHAARRRHAALGRRGRRPRAAARQPGAHGPSLPARARRRWPSTWRSCATPPPAAAARRSGCSGRPRPPSLPEAATPPRPPRSARLPRRRLLRPAQRSSTTSSSTAARSASPTAAATATTTASRSRPPSTACRSSPTAGPSSTRASFAERNRFRSTAYHNTPQVDGAEMNRLQPDLLWSLEYDARPVVRRFETSTEADVFCGAHAGYERLPAPVTPVRTIVLDHRSHALTITDAFEGAGRHRIEIPLHLAPGVDRVRGRRGSPGPAPGSRVFGLDWEPAGSWSSHDRRGTRVALLRGRGEDRSPGLLPRGRAHSRAHDPHRPGGSTVTTRPWPYHCRMRPGEVRP